MRNIPLLALVLLLFLIVVPTVSAVNPGEGINASVVTMLHMNGTQGGVSFPDESSYNHPATAFGGAHTNTSAKKFGTASANFDGIGDYLTITAGAADYNFGAGDMTIDTWINCTTNQANNRRILSWSEDEFGLEIVSDKLYVYAVPDVIPVL